MTSPNQRSSAHLREDPSRGLGWVGAGGEGGTDDMGPIMRHTANPVGFWPLGLCFGLCVLSACGAPPAKSSGMAERATDGETGMPASDSGIVEEEAPDCAELDLEVVGSWEQGELPQRDDITKTMQGVAVGDLDGDGWLDALVGWGGGSFGLRNDGTGQLVIDEAIRGTEGPLPQGVSAALADLDGDGDLDGFLGSWTRDVEVLWNDGSGVFEVVPLPGSRGATVSIAFGDVDGDGDLDAYLSQAVGNMDYEAIASGMQVGDVNKLLIQGDDHVFTLAPERLPEGTGHGMTLHSNFIDVDLDGDLDLYLGNDAGPYILPNLLLINDGTGFFQRASDCACELPMLSMGVGVGDANQDGWPDLYVTDVGPPHLLQNMGDRTFADVTLPARAVIEATENSMVSWGTGFLDIDGDMDQDIVVTFGQSGQNFHTSGAEGVDGEFQPDQIWLSDGEGHFSRAAVPGFQDGARSRAYAAGDFDRDGRPDLIVVGKYFLRQWHTVGGCDPGVTLKLRGKNLVGTQVDSTVAGVVRRGWHFPSISGSSSADELYIGLGGRAKAERIEVVFPSGERAVLEDVPLGSSLEIDG